MRRFFVICVLSTLPFSVFGQREVSFIEEYIDFSIGESGFETNGIYVFANNGDREVQMEIRFPFALGMDSIDVQRVYNLSYNKTMPYRSLNKSISFMLELAARDTVYINIAYTQTLLKNNVYILRSTQAWGKPLQKAQYSLTVHDSLSIENFSYLPDSQEDNVYHWEKYDFLPTEDFEVGLSFFGLR